MTDFQKQNWLRKFANAWRGLVVVARSQKSFWVHSIAAVFVLLAGILLSVTAIEGLILGLCVVTVMTAELLNSSIEYLSRKVSQEESSLIRDSLDAAAGAVLVASLGSAVIGAVILVPRFWAIVFPAG